MARSLSMASFARNDLKGDRGLLRRFSLGLVGLPVLAHEGFQNTY